MATAKLYPSEDPRSPDHAIAHLSLEAQQYIRLLSLPHLDLPEDDPRVQKRQAALDAMVSGFAEEELEQIASAATLYEELLEQERVEIEREFAEFDPQAELAEARQAADAAAAADTEPPKISDGLARYLGLVKKMDAPEMTVENPEYSDLLTAANAEWNALSTEEQEIAERILEQELQAKAAGEPLDDRAVPVMDPVADQTGIVDESGGDEPVIDEEEVVDTDDGA